MMLALGMASEVFKWLATDRDFVGLVHRACKLQRRLQGQHPQAKQQTPEGQHPRSQQQAQGAARTLSAAGAGGQHAEQQQEVTSQEEHPKEQPGEEGAPGEVGAVAVRLGASRAATALCTW